uniref:Uncharacterized protein n=1 Tax=Utricularia reniformis TaxID=192314 RepID=A0A1Y0B453_9LAMI|nr:hypothetical protein AEK19_MT2080 [Utricularia reniformis]ART32235.1 hypothetical protein AEK19_MT2080 [Utricularia reniformis]
MGQESILRKGLDIAADQQKPTLRLLAITFEGQGLFPFLSLGASALKTLNGL